MFGTSHGPALSRAPFAALLAAAALASGCLEQPYPAAAEETRSALVVEDAGELAQQIAAHPSYAQLSELIDGDLSRTTAALAALPVKQGREVHDALLTCSAQGDLATCTNILGNLGLMTAEDKQARAAASDAAAQIAADLGLAELPPAEVAAGFRGAQILNDGMSGGSALVELVMTEVAAPCDLACRQSIGNGLGPAKAEYGAILAESSISGSGSVSISGDGNGDEIGGIIAVITIGVEIAKLLEKWIWDSGEEDKECTSDDDCNDNQFCHKTGENDCRARLGLDHLCTRHNQCASRCCKSHISAGFMPICRPADRC